MKNSERFQPGNPDDFTPATYSAYLYGMKSGYDDCAELARVVRDGLDEGVKAALAAKIGDGQKTYTLEELTKATQALVHDIMLTCEHAMTEKAHKSLKKSQMSKEELIRDAERVLRGDKE